MMVDGFDAVVETRLFRPWPQQWWHLLGRQSWAGLDESPCEDALFGQGRLPSPYPFADVADRFLGKAHLPGDLPVGVVGEHAHAPGRVRRNMPNPMPVMVIGRLAIDHKFQRRGIGSALLRDAVLRTVQAAEIAI